MTGDAIDYWNRVGPAKPFSVPIDLARLGTLLTRDARIVDIGCGYGRVLQILRDEGYHRLIGVDPAASMIEAARQRVPEAELHVMSSPPIVPLPDRSVDAALLVGVLTAIPGDDDQRALVAETARVLTRGGVMAHRRLLDSGRFAQPRAVCAVAARGLWRLRPSRRRDAPSSHR